MIIATVSLIVGCGLGILILYFIQVFRQRSRLNKAQTTAQQIIEATKKRVEEIVLSAQKRGQDIETRIRQRYQKEVASKQARLKELDEELREKRSQFDREYNVDDRELQKLVSVISERDRHAQEHQARYDEKREKYQQLRTQLIEKLLQVTGSQPDDMKAGVQESIEQQIHIEARKKANQFEDDIRANADEIAKRILSTVLARFPREYCPERGVGVVEVPNEEVKKKLLANDRAALQAVESLCGVDVSIQEETGTLAVSGFDPVRRELTTRSLEKLVKERNITPEVVQRLVEKTKRDLFRRIEDDGKRISKELGQAHFHPEIQNMLGSLRYRYSFAQNQHFHVAEVGWLCGLLASEIGEHVPSAKRAGLLHDIGKAMDHSIEGGHAVIGADFIQERGEEPHVVHAVRAHHFEEQPRTDLAFLVIAADAISGARPGARRSTVSSYNQKMEVLETIGDGFNGVTKTLVFNAGREVRVIVDGGRVNDEQSLVLCRQIADKIESELSYPGQIKVVVVRETHAEAVAK